MSQGRINQLCEVNSLQHTMRHHMPLIGILSWEFPLTLEHSGTLRCVLIKLVLSLLISSVKQPPHVRSAASWNSCIATTAYIYSCVHTDIVWFHFSLMVWFNPFLCQYVFANSVGILKECAKIVVDSVSRNPIDRTVMFGSR
jgi:hypothetical protein